VWTTCPELLLCKGAAGSRTSDLLVMNPMPRLPSHQATNLLLVCRFEWAVARMDVENRSVELMVKNSTSVFSKDRNMGHLCLDLAQFGDLTNATTDWYDNTCYRICALFIFNFYAWKQLLLSAHLSHRNSVCLSVTQVDQSKTVQAGITKSSPAAAWKTLVLGTVKLFHKFEGGHPEWGC